MLGGKQPRDLHRRPARIEPAGDDRHPGFMVESPTILASNGNDAALCGIEGEVDIRRAALACSTKANFPWMA